MNQLNTDHFKKQYHFWFFLGSLESATSTFIEKTDVPSSLWKTHISEERSDISSELECSGLAYLEQWHYSVFQSNGTCSLGKISNESETVTGGSNQKMLPWWLRYGSKWPKLYAHFLLHLFSVLDFP